MTKDDFNAFCGSLPAATHVVQWNGGEVWKVGGKLFAAGWFGDGKYDGITFKVSPLVYEVLKDQPGLRPAPYLASRGMKWIQHHAQPGLTDAALREHITESHRLVSLKLTKQVQRELNLNQA